MCGVEAEKPEAAGILGWFEAYGNFPIGALGRHYRCRKQGNIL